MQIAVIGGGAAGFFAAINCAEQCPQHRVIILEKSGKLLSKVRVSGGGRCNVTHACRENALLASHYPRGEKALLSPFSRFSVQDTVNWFAARGVQLKTEADGRMFPESNSSLTVVNCFLEQAAKYQVEVRLNAGVRKVVRGSGHFELVLENGQTLTADKVLVAVGGNAKGQAYDWLRALGHTIAEPVPSLFTFNIPNNPVTSLMGVSAPARIKVNGTSLENTGPLLITHWGMSGPAVLRLSSIGARMLHQLGYNFNISINWLPFMSPEALRSDIDLVRKSAPASRIISSKPVDLPARLWEHLAEKSGIPKELRWADLSNKLLGVLLRHLQQDEYHVKGKTTFKEEFVTCGGIKLNEVNFRTMESKVVPGLYFAGEVLDVDGVTGGFNFQAAWSTAMSAAAALCS